MRNRGDSANPCVILTSDEDETKGSASDDPDYTPKSGKTEDGDSKRRTSAEELPSDIDVELKSSRSRKSMTSRRSNASTDSTSTTASKSSTRRKRSTSNSTSSRKRRNPGPRMTPGGPSPVTLATVVESKAPGNAKRGPRRTKTNIVNPIDVSKVPPKESRTHSESTDASSVLPDVGTSSDQISDGKEATEVTMPKSSRKNRKPLPREENFQTDAVEVVQPILNAISKASEEVSPPSVMNALAESLPNPNEDVSMKNETGQNPADVAEAVVGIENPKLPPLLTDLVVELPVTARSNLKTSEAPDVIKSRAESENVRSAVEEELAAMVGSPTKEVVANPMDVTSPKVIESDSGSSLAKPTGEDRTDSSKNDAAQSSKDVVEPSLETLLSSKVLKVTRKLPTSRAVVTATPAPSANKNDKSKNEDRVVKEKAIECDVLLVARQKILPTSSELLAACAPRIMDLVKVHKVIGRGMVRVPIECDEEILPLFLKHMKHKDRPVSFEDAKKLLGPSTKYDVKDLLSRCESALIGGTTDENLLELKFLVLEAANKELNRFVDDSLQANLQSAKPSILQSKTLLDLKVEQLAKLISRESTQLPAECIHRLTAAWLDHKGRDENMALLTQLKTLELLRCDSTFDASIFDGKPPGLPIFQSEIPGWTYLKSLVTPKKTLSAVRTMTMSNIGTPVKVEAGGGVAGKSPLSLQEKIGRRKRAYEEMEESQKVVPDALDFVKPLSSNFKIPKVRNSSSSSSVIKAEVDSPSDQYDPVSDFLSRRKGGGGGGGFNSGGSTPFRRQDSSFHSQDSLSPAINSGVSCRGPMDNSNGWDSNKGSKDWDSPPVPPQRIGSVVGDCRGDGGSSGGRNSGGWTEGRAPTRSPVGNDDWDSGGGMNRKWNERGRNRSQDSSDSFRESKNRFGNSSGNFSDDGWGEKKSDRNGSYGNSDRRSSDNFMDWDAAPTSSGGNSGMNRSGGSNDWDSSGNSRGQSQPKNSNDDWDDWGTGSTSGPPKGSSPRSSSPSSSFGERRRYSDGPNRGSYGGGGGRGGGSWDRGGGRGRGRGGGRGGREPRPDDWACESCDYKTNFGSRSSCYKCDAPKPGGLGSSNGGGFGVRGRGRGRGRGGRGSRDGFDSWGSSSWGSRNNAGGGSSNFDDWDSGSGAQSTAAKTTVDDEDDWDAPPSTSAAQPAPKQSDDWGEAPADKPKTSQQVSSGGDDDWGEAKKTPNAPVQNVSAMDEDDWDETSKTIPKAVVSNFPVATSVDEWGEPKQPQKAPASNTPAATNVDEWGEPNKPQKAPASNTPAASNVDEWGKPKQPAKATASNFPPATSVDEWDESKETSKAPVARGSHNADEWGDSRTSAPSTKSNIVQDEWGKPMETNQPAASKCNNSSGSRESQHAAASGAPWNKLPRNTPINPGSVGKFKTNDWHEDSPLQPANAGNSTLPSGSAAIRGAYECASSALSVQSRPELDDDCDVIFVKEIEIPRKPVVVKTEPGLKSSPQTEKPAGRNANSSEPPLANVSDERNNENNNNHNNNGVGHLNDPRLVRRNSCGTPAGQVPPPSTSATGVDTVREGLVAVGDEEGKPWSLSPIEGVNPQVPPVNSRPETDIRPEPIIIAEVEAPAQNGVPVDPRLGKSLEDDWA